MKKTNIRFEQDKNKKDNIIFSVVNKFYNTPAIITVFVLRDLRGAHSVPYTINDETCIIQY